MHRMTWRMLGIGAGLVTVALGAGAMGQAHEGEHDEAQEAAASAGQPQTLTGEVVDVFCYLSHGAEGQGKSHADCAKKCIGSGMPVAIKVGDALYLATMADHNPANKTLVQYAGQQVTVQGEVLEQDGQRLIAVKSVEKAP